MCVFYNIEGLIGTQCYYVSDHFAVSETIANSSSVGGFYLHLTRHLDQQIWVSFSLLLRPLFICCDPNNEPADLRPSLISYYMNEPAILCITFWLHALT